jgi:hypothetical protein
VTEPKPMQPSPSEIQDYSMLSRRWSGEKLITGSIALQIARLIHHQTYGQADLDANEPLGIRDEQDVWIVSGVKIVPFDPAGPVLDGPLEMRISKYDGQILSYLFRFALSHPKSP